MFKILKKVVKFAALAHFYFIANECVLLLAEERGYEVIKHGAYDKVRKFYTPWVNDIIDNENIMEAVGLRKKEPKKYENWFN